MYYAIYSIKDNKIGYVVFKEIDKILYTDYIWIYTEDLIDANKILDIEIGTKSNVLETIDKNTLRMDMLSSKYYTVHSFKDGRGATINIDQHNNIDEIIVNNNIYDVIDDMDHPEKIIK